MDELERLCEALKAMGEKDAAIALIDALGRHASDYKEYDLLARISFKLKLYSKAVVFTEKTLALANTNSQRNSARHNLVNVYAHAYEPEKALDEVKILELSTVNDPDLRLKKAYALFLVGKLDEAEKILREELAADHTDAKTKNEIEFNLGTYELYKDNFQEGLYRFLIHGRQMSLWEKPQLPFKQWDNVVRPGDTIVIRQEAGIGDEIINFRFMKHFKDLGMEPIWFTDRKEMAEIFKRHGYDAVTSVDQLPRIENMWWCHSMDIPVLLNLEYKDLWYGPYLTSTKEEVLDWCKDDVLKIGLRWQGNPDYDNDLHRSVPLDDLMSVVGELDADLFSLQRDTGADDVFEYPNVYPLHEDYLKTFEETMAIIDQLDIIITSCTSIAHAAAAMGKRVFIFTPMSSYYTWCHSDKYKHSPWYGENVTVLRQRRPRYWDEPLQELREHLAKL